MISKVEARNLVITKLEELERQFAGEPSTILDEQTIDKPYGWVFFYNSKKYLETGDIRHALAGNGPVIVNKYDGTIEFHGAYKRPEAFIKEYELKIEKK